MKQFAFGLAALLATSVMAQEESEEMEKPFKLTLSYSSIDDLFLGLEVDNPVRVDLPCAKSRRIECTGWELLDDSITYDDFIITREVTTNSRGHESHHFVFTADGANDIDGAEVIFENTCKQDDLGNNEQVSIHVMASGPRDD